MLLELRWLADAEIRGRTYLLKWMYVVVIVWHQRIGAPNTVDFEEPSESLMFVLPKWHTHASYEFAPNISS